MSEVIVRMEMPTGCPNCPMADDDSRFCKAAKEYIPMLGRPSWCPIVGELPEQHGRLIDEAVFCENVVKYSHQSTKTIGKALDATPTILDMTLIDTERSETNGNATTPNTKWESITIKTGDKASDFWT